MPRNIITVPTLPNGEESGISIDITKKIREPYRYTPRKVPAKEISLGSVSIIANQIINKNLTRHQRKRNDYDGRGKLDLRTLAQALHYNHSTDIHESIIGNSTDISYVNLYYGDKKVRIEANGHIMAILLYYRNMPKPFPKPQGWKCLYNANKILLYTEGENLISGDVTLFNYTNPLKIFRASIIDSKGVLHEAEINVEGVDYWEYLEGNWETMDSVHWDNYKSTY